MSASTSNINYLIQESKKEPDFKIGNVSDGYHTFDELYEHRIVLYIALCRLLSERSAHYVWKSKKHSDGSEIEGWFVLGIGTRPGAQITYHLPMSKWDDTSFATELSAAPEWDGHISADVLERVSKLTK